MSKKAQRRRKGKRKEEAKRMLREQGVVWRKLTGIKTPRRGVLVSPGVSIRFIDVSVIIPAQPTEIQVVGIMDNE